MTETALTRQSLVGHLFAPLGGPHADTAIRYLKRRWQVFRSSAGATNPITETGLPTGFPPSLPNGSVLIAAQQSADRDIQVVLRREHEILNISVLLAARSTATWTDHDSWLDDLLGKQPTDALTGLVRVYLARVEQPVRENGQAARDLLPPPPSASGWWHRPYAEDGFALWDTATAPANGVARRIVLLTHPDHARRVGNWIWAPGGHAQLPRLARYFMHIAKIRYQHRVWSDWQESADLRSEGNSATLIHNLGAMRGAVEDTWSNAVAALDPIIADPAGDDPFAADAAYTTWLIEQLNREIDRVETYFDRAHRMPGGGIQRVDRSISSRPVSASAAGSRSRRLLALSMEWIPRRSSAAVINRYLCQALAAVGTDVYCLVPDPSESDRKDAEAAGVQLIEAKPFPGASARQALGRRQELPGDVRPDAVIGYGLETGPAAQAQATNHYPGTPWLHIVLDRPHETDPPDPVDEALVLSAEDRATDLLALGRTASRVLSVGPGTHGWLERELPEEPAGPFPSRFNPGFDGGGHHLRTPPLGMPQLLLVSGADEMAAKGVAIAAKAIAMAVEFAGGNPLWELLVRGAAREHRAAFQDAVREWIGPTTKVRIGDDSAGFEQLNADLKRASLVLVPSRFGEFGVVAMEAIASGVPILVSDSSGLGLLLRDELREDSDNSYWFTAPTDSDSDVQAWAHRIAAILNDRHSAFTRVQSARQVLASRRTWAAAANQLLDAVPLQPSS